MNKIEQVFVNFLNRSHVIITFGTGGGDRTHTEWILSPLPLPDWATPALYSGAEEETRTPTPFGTGILNRHVYHSITSA